MTHCINGQWLTGGGDNITKTDPVDGELLWQGKAATAGQVTSACEAARAAFPAWARRPFSERQSIAEKFAVLLEKNKVELSETISRETGKPRWETQTEVQAMINKVPIWEKVTLTIDEAAEYSNIGVNKLREITNNPRCQFVMYVGKRRLIKRKEFEKYIAESIEI